MSETKLGEVVTFDKYREYRVKQDKDLGIEFGRLRTQIEDGNESLRLDNESLRSELTTQIENSNKSLRVELTKVKDDVSQMKARLDQIDGRSYNKLRFLPTHDIARIGAYRPAAGFEIPNYFPRTLKEFWRLKLPKNKEKLKYLIQFYDIHGYKHWGEPIQEFNDSFESDGNSTSESDDSSQNTLLLEDAIRKYPLKALEELAARIGIVFEKIRKFFDENAEYQQRPQQPAAKRQSEEVDVTRKADAKRAKILDPDASFPPRSVRLVQSTSTSTSPPTKLDWDLESIKRRKEALLQKEDPGSTTEEITPQSQERLPTRKKGSR